MATEASISAPQNPLSAGGRGLSLIEFLVGAAVVIAHNVFHAIPNEVPILVVLGIVSIRLRDGSWRAIGLGRPKSWLATITIAIAATTAILAMGIFVTDPLAHKLGLHAATSATQTANKLGMQKNDPLTLVRTLAIIWVLAGFGEEIGYRRYLLGRAADVGGRSVLAYWTGLFIVSGLFGLGHYYQGSAGMFTTACDGFAIGAVYLLSGRNLWVAILTHGLIDTVGFVAVFFGIAD